jgi:hypothetical protein
MAEMLAKRRAKPLKKSAGPSVLIIEPKVKSKSKPKAAPKKKPAKARKKVPRRGK